LAFYYFQKFQQAKKFQNLMADSVSLTTDRHDVIHCRLRNVFAGFNRPLDEQGDIVLGLKYGEDILAEHGGVTGPDFFGELIWFWSWRNSPTYMEAGRLGNGAFEYIKSKPATYFRDPNIDGMHHTPGRNWNNYNSPSKIEETLRRSNFDPVGFAADKCFQACKANGNTYANLDEFIKALKKKGVLWGVSTYQAANTARFLFMFMGYRMPSCPTGFLKMSDSNSEVGEMFRKFGIVTDGDFNTLLGTNCDAGEVAYLHCECFGPAFKVSPILASWGSCAATLIDEEENDDMITISMDLPDEWSTEVEYNEVDESAAVSAREEEESTSVKHDTPRARQLRNRRKRKREEKERIRALNESSELPEIAIPLESWTQPFLSLADDQLLSSAWKKKITIIIKKKKKTTKL
jgi:hypothetical protein